MRRKYWLLLVSLLLAIGGLAGCETHLNSQKYVQETTPTLFFHGGGSSYHAEEHMAKAAKQAGVTRTIIRAMVDRKGHVRLVGRIKSGAINPIVEVNYADNKQMNYRTHGIWAINVVRALQKQYHFKTINLVGHSLGNISLIYYSLEAKNQHNLPKLRKQVDIAGHFAGLHFKNMPAAVKQPAGLRLDAAGKPNKMNATYREMTQLRQVLPDHQVKVLNLYGNIGGHTDGTVPNVSSLSLKYLVQPRAKSYQERVFTGKLARHSKLHENPAVDRVLIHFLWGK